MVSLLVFSIETEVLKHTGDQTGFFQIVSHKYGWMLCSGWPSVTTLVTH